MTTEQNSDFYGMSENAFIAMMHVSQLAGYIIPGLGFAAPIVLWLMKRDISPKVDFAGKQIINFMLSLLLYYIIAAVLCLILIGFALLFVLAALELAFAIIAAIKASNGETNWEYPFTFKFLK
jgi:uncharacterized Tic20 family protein